MNSLRMLAVSALAFGLLVGCSAGGGDSASPAVSPVPLEDAAKQGGEAGDTRQSRKDLALDGMRENSALTDSVAAGQGRLDKPVPPKEAKPRNPVSKANLLEQSRKLARTASLKIRVPNMEEAAADARQLADRVGGFVGSESSRKTSTRMTLVVPGTKLDSVLTDLEELGTRIDRKISIDDVTDEVVDVDSRVKSQRRSVIRARALLDRANTISEIVRVEEELADREEELESLLARQEALQGQVAMAPITLALLPTKPKPKPSKSDDDDEPVGFLAGLAGGWDAFVTVLTGLATAVGAAAPFLLVFGLPALGVLWAWRRRRHKPTVAAESS